MIEKILNREEFLNEPPVLIDVGASGELNEKWNVLSKYSVLVAFDADERDFDYIKNKKEQFRELHIVNTIVSNREEAELDFYLTNAPQCSSLLAPVTEELESWAFADFFKVQEKLKLKNTSLQAVLSEYGISYIDWLKIDSQGMDFKIYKNIPESIRDKVIIAEFEPGILNAYSNEDKLFTIMGHFTGKNYWMHKMEVKKTVRHNASKLSNVISAPTNMLLRNLERAPGWAEIGYLKLFNEGSYSKREILFACIVAIIEEQYSYGLELVVDAKQAFEDDLFVELEQYFIEKITQMLQEDDYYEHLLNHCLYDSQHISDLLKTVQKPVYIFGAGSFGIKLYSHLINDNINVSGFVDNSEMLQGSQLLNSKVYALQDCSKESFFIVASTWHKEITAQLIQAGYKPKDDFIVVEM